MLITLVAACNSNTCWYWLILPYHTGSSVRRNFKREGPGKKKTTWAAAGSRGLGAELPAAGGYEGLGAKPTYMYIQLLYIQLICINIRTFSCLNLSSYIKFNFVYDT